MKPDCMTAKTQELVCTTVVILKMLVSGVNVSNSISWTSTTQLCLCLPILSKEYVHSLIQIYQCISIVVCQDGQIRLSGGRNSAEGRVEICFNNQWGTVCDDFWSNDDGSVVCRQLGFSPTGINIIHTFAIYLYELASH